MAENSAKPSTRERSLLLGHLLFELSLVGSGKVSGRLRVGDRSGDF